MSSSPEEVESDGGEDEEVSHVGAHTRKKRGRRPIPPEYPRVEVVHDIPEEEKVCPCGCQLTRIGEEVSEKLDIIPQKIQVIRTIRPKYACRACEGVEDEGPTVKIASMPPQIIPQGIVTPGLLAYILTNKFEDGLPFYRQQKMFDRLGVDISRGVMSAWALRAAETCVPLIELVHNHILSGSLINMDESPVQVLLEPGRKIPVNHLCGSRGAGHPVSRRYCFITIPVEAAVWRRNWWATSRAICRPTGTPDTTPWVHGTA